MSCTLLFENVSNNDLKEYLEENCDKIIDAHDCLLAAKDNYEEIIRPIREADQEGLLGDLEASVANSGVSFLTLRQSALNFYTIVKQTDQLQTIYEAYEGHYEKVSFKEDTGKLEAKARDFEADGYSKALVFFENLEYAADLSKSMILQQSDYIQSEFEQKLNAIILACEQARQNIEESQECAKNLREIEKKHKKISTDAIGIKIAAADRGLGDLSGAKAYEESEQRAEEAKNNLEQKKNAGKGITIFRIPPNFREQCLFLAQIFQFAELHKNIEQQVGTGEPVNKSLPYVGINEGSNASLVVEGSPFGFINRLTQYASMSNYFDATNDQLAHLQPLIRIFKVTPEKGEGSGGIIEREQEFAFDTFASKEDVSDLLKATNRRGFGIGIEKFNFTFHGSNPFAIKKSIKANLVIKANNFSELLRPRGPNNSYRYIDLALKTGKSIKEKTGNPELDYRIKAIVGLSVPNGKTTARYKGKGPGDTGDITEAVKNNFATLNLTPVIHTFDFDDTGAVTFSIEYLAYIEEFLDKARMNVFADPVVSKRMMERRLAIQTQKTNCSEDEQVKNLNSFLEEDAVLTNRDKITSLQFLTRELLKSNKMYYLNLNKEQFKDLVEKGPFYDVLDLEKAVGLAQSPKILQDIEEKFIESYDKEKKLEDSVKNSFKISDLESKNYAFFYLGDLVDLILKKIPENLDNMRELGDSYRSLQIEREKISEEEEIIASSYEKFKKFRFILGPLEIIDHRNGSQSKSVSFADVPIALDYFNEWLTSKLLQNDRVAYPLTTFLNDLMNDLVSNFLNDDTCYNFNIKQKTRVFQSMITSYSDDSEAPINDQITNYLVQKGQTRLDIDDVDYNIMRKPILSTGGYREYQIPKKDPSKEFHFFVFYAGRVQPKQLMQGNKKDDEDAGIFHYVLGKDRGIVKTIKLNKTDSPASLKMVRFEQEGYDGLQQLREIYDVDVTTFANLGTYPGTYIFVDPRGFSPDLSSFDQSKFDLTDLGIGGYYMIIESTHEFSSGVMNTSFRAKWVQAIESEENERQNNSSTGNGEQVTKKCSVRS
jgi:hypothetical protein